jgi:hypothetical protein
MPDAIVRWGRGAEVADAPAADWLAALRERAPRTRAALRLEGAARAVREFVVRELPRAGGRPIEPGRISSALSLSPAGVAGILADLETRLFFLVRDASGAVSWAFPVTSARTPHHLQFSTGEATWGA